jgi:hypothetical protein
MFDYSSKIFAYYNSTLNYYNSGWNSVGSLTKPTNALVPRPVSMNQNLYITSSSGLKKLDSTSSTLYSAGIPSGLMMTLTEASGTGTAIPTAKYVAYRYIITRIDANNNLIRGGVSGREIYSNTSGSTKNVVVQGYLPTSIDNSYVIELYRSDDSSVASVSDELYKCYELPVYSQFFSTYTKTISSVDTATEKMTSNSHGFLDGMVVRFTTTGTLPSPLATGTDYFVVGATTNDFQVSTTYGGSAVNLTTTGSGTHTVQGANQFALLDISPSSLLGDTLYTSPSQDGIVNNNFVPPLASDICEFKQHMIYADVSSKYRFNFTLVGVYDGVSSGELRNGDTITISDGTTTEVYTANSSAANASTKNFKVDQASASVSTRIDNTIRSFISIVNQASTLCYAYLTTTGDDDIPGKCLLESRSLGSSAFYVVSTRQKAFNPQLTSSQTTIQTSQNDNFRNAIMVSKPGEPEAVPLGNIFKVGSSDDPIKRIIPLRDSVLIFKAKDGIYRLIGENLSNFSISLLDATAKVVAPESLVVLNSQIYGLFESGVCAVSDTTVDVVSDPVADKIQELYGTCLSQIQSYAFAVAYETEGHYILSLPQTSSDTWCTYQLLYNVFNENWWEWDVEVGTGYVSSTDGKLYFGAGNNSRVLKEFKSFSYTDFADYEQDCVLSSAVGTTLTLTGTSSMSVGDIVEHDGYQPGYIVAVDSTSNEVTVDNTLDWYPALPVKHYKAIDCEIEWNPDFAGNPAGMKHYIAANLLFATSIIRNARLSFSSDVSPGVNSVNFDGPSASGAWGYVEWGEGVWGGESSPAPVRLGVPRLNARCNSLTVKLTHSVARSDFQLSGLSLEFNPFSVRTAR